MAKMWAGVTDGMTAKIADDFNSSIHFDSRMYRQDITGSMAHAAMLATKRIISQADADKLIGAYIPSSWVESTQNRMACYTRLAKALTTDDTDDLEREWIDR